mgnify:CR=1 FL=1
MPRLPLTRFAGVLLILVLSFVSAAHAEESSLPPIAGGFRGIARALFIPELPDMQWDVTIDGLSREGIRATVTAEAPEMLFRASVLYRINGDVDWELQEGRIGLARWLEIFAERPELQAVRQFSITGSVHLAGSGAVREGVLSGEATAELRDGSLSDPVSGLIVKGIAGFFRLTSLDPLLGDAPQIFTFSELSVAGLTVTDGFVRARMSEENIVDVTSVGMQVLGGTISVDPFRFSLLNPEIEAQARFSKMRLADAVPLIPDVLAAAEGQLSGRVVLRWSEKDGPSVGDARLRVERDSPPIIRLAPKSGLLTSALPPRFEVLPRRRFGSLAWFLSLNNPAHRQARDIELGVTRLNVDSLRLRLHPNGDNEGRSLTLTLEAHPSDQSLVEKVTFQVNVRGPLQMVIQQIGLNSTATISAH